MGSSYNAFETIFDFHTHAFVDSLAERAVSALAETSSRQPATDGTVSGLLRTLRSNNISGGMLLPIATKPSQQHTINNWAAQVMQENDMLYSCGTVHPDAEDILDEVRRISSLGLCGLKFHSEYQHFRPDEERMLPVYRLAGELGLFVVFHGGWDPFGTGDVLAKPCTFAHIAPLCPETTFIAAHMGGLQMFDEAEEQLAGRYGNVYLDTGVVSGYISDGQLLRMIRKQGAERILFGSDVPWDPPENEIAMIKRIGLTAEERELIFRGNAARLLRASGRIK
ncbi:MAG: amidohydrolase [Ruminococcus sp.]|nr:amidohydrolase [Ruminococcus sp.]